MDPLDTSAAPVYRFDIHVGATHTRNAWLLLPKTLRSSESAGKKKRPWDYQMSILVYGIDIFKQASNNKAFLYYSMHG